MLGCRTATTYADRFSQRIAEFPSPLPPMHRKPVAIIKARSIDHPRLDVARVCHAFVTRSRNQPRPAPFLPHPSTSSFIIFNYRVLATSRRAASSLRGETAPIFPDKPVENRNAARFPALSPAWSIPDCVQTRNTRTGARSTEIASEEKTITDSNFLSVSRTRA